MGNVMRSKGLLLAAAAVVAGFVAIQLGCATTSMGAYPEVEVMEMSVNFDAQERKFANTVPTASGLKDWETTRGAVGRYFENQQTPQREIPMATPGPLWTEPDGLRITWV